MPDKCCVPGCRSNYDGEKDKVSVFKFPTDPERKQLWLKKIPRADFVPSKRSVVCARHFSEQFIVKVDSVKRPDGTVLSVERQAPKLSKDAYPSKFHNCPVYLSSEPPTKRKKPDDRRAEAEQMDEDFFQDWMEKDKILRYSEFTAALHEHMGKKWIHRNSNSESTGLFTSFYHISDESCGNNGPTLHSTIRVYSDLHVEVFTDNGVRVPDTKLKWIFGQHLPCTLERWSQFDCLLSYFSSERQEETSKRKIQSQVDVLCQTCSNLYESYDGDEEEYASMKKLMFLVEQLKLWFCQQKRYSCESLLFAFQIYSSSPSTYSCIRSNILSLPSISYLRKLSTVFTINSGVNSENTHEHYLQQKCKNQREEERSVILMIDEIHVAHNISYTGGKLEGMAFNTSTSEASTAQVFMISSYFSKNKDVAAIVPVKNINAKALHELTQQVLQMLHNAGYFVMCLISDNNRINRNCFTSMCGGTLVPWIQHPFHPSQKLFFLFDSVHLFKCIRNNWLSQKDTEKTFIFPSFTHHDSTSKAVFYQLRRLYNTEKSSPIKLAPALNNKSMFPTNTERQNVNLMLKVFDIRNSVALAHYGDVWKIDTNGTQEFVNLVTKLWNIMNVKHPLKGVRLRNDDCQPIRTMTDDNIQFLSAVLIWLEAWEKSPVSKPREGGLSHETMFALKHTIKTAIDLCQHLIMDKKCQYVLLGKFQTDNLEFRFSQYRQLSGSNYNVSVRQVLEGEKKLKLMIVLKLVSASKGTIAFKDLTDNLYDVYITNTVSSNTDFLQFIECLPECDNVKITPEQSRVLVFIAGYAASKVLQTTTCEMCKSDIIIQEKRFTVQTVDESYRYLDSLDRGGLVWPSQTVVDIVTVIFSVFQVIIGNKETEQRFLRCENQQFVIMELALRSFKNKGFNWIECEACQTNLEDILKKACKPTINILLNNYSKNLSDKTGTDRVRKLKTFTKRI